MTLRTVGLAALWLVLTTAPTGAAGEKPNLSGTWEFDPAESRLEMPAPEKSTFWIEHRNGNFKLTRTHVWRERWDTMSFEVTTDGQELYKKIGDAEFWTRASWEGEELVLDMKLADQGQLGTNIVHYRLIDAGQTFVAAEWFHMAERRRHNLWVLKRATNAPAADHKNRLKEFAERYTVAWGSRDPGSVATFFSENGLLRVNDGEPAVGRDAIAEVARGFMTDLPDMVLTFDGLEGRGDRVRFYWTLDATNSGPGGTGNRVRVSGHETWRLDEDGLIAESRGHFPTAEYEKQLEIGYSQPTFPE